MTEHDGSTTERVILAATDLSGPADEAVRQAHERARAADARLVVCHVVPDVMRVNMLFPQRTLQQVNAHAALHQRALDALVERTCRVTGRSPGEFDPVVDEGIPYPVIVARAEQVRAELVVVGDRGATGLARVLLGSVAERVVRYAHAPVLVARPGTEVSHVVVATDLSHPSLPAVAAGASEARRTGARVTVVHCLEHVEPLVGPDYGLGWPPAAAASVVTEAHERARARLAEALARLGFEGDQRVEEGPPVATILGAAEQLQAGLVVVGTRGNTGLERVLLGSVAEAVVRHAGCSVLVVRLLASPRGGPPAGA